MLFQNILKQHHKNKRTRQNTAQRIIKNESSAFPPITFFPEGVDVVLQGRSSDFSDSCFLPVETYGFNSGIEVLSKNTILFFEKTKSELQQRALSRFFTGVPF
jgi:hypothetical protein